MWRESTKCPEGWEGVNSKRGKRHLQRERQLEPRHRRDGATGSSGT